jgi:hypothetical protein
MGSAIRFQELKSDAAVFYEWNERMRLKRQFLDLACRLCGKLDPLAAASRGISISLRKGTSADALLTRDLQPIVSTRLREFLRRSLSDAVTFYPLTDSAYHLAIPSKLLIPSTKARHDAPFTTHGRPCSHCGRFAEVTVRPRDVVLPGGAELVGIWCEDKSLGCPNILWTCTEPFAAKLQSAPFRGLTVVSGFFGTDSKVQRRAEQRKQRLKSGMASNSWTQLMDGK